MKRIIIACLSTVALVCAGAGVAMAGGPPPEVDPAAVTLTMNPAHFATTNCTGTETIDNVFTNKPYENLTGTWTGTSKDNLPTDTPYSLTGSFSINVASWTINLNTAEPGNVPGERTGVLTGTATLTNKTGQVLTGQITLITKYTTDKPDPKGLVEARGWMNLAPTRPPGPGEYLLNVAFKIQPSFAATGTAGNLAFNFPPWAVYYNNSLPNGCQS